MKKIISLLALMMVSLQCHGELISRHTTYSTNSEVTSTNLNGNFDNAYNLVNGNIENVNIKAGAAIADTKLATISTAGKVSGAALTSLSSIPSGAGTVPLANISGLVDANIAAGATIAGSKLGTLATISASAGIIPVANLEAFAWTSYGATSTITGFSSVATKNIYYTSIGKVTYVAFEISGTSNTTTFSFTIPVRATATGPTYYRNLIMASDSGSTTAGMAQLPANDILMTCYTTPAGGPWTASGTKSVYGILVFERE